MTELSKITLENEMDLTLAYKRSMRIAVLLGLTLSTQTSFSTAVSDVCREVIDKATNGLATLGAVNEDGRFFITAVIKCNTSEYFNKSSEGIEYARKLVPILEITAKEETLVITLKLGIPRATRIDSAKIIAVKDQLEQEGPLSAYEEVKLRNNELLQLNQQNELALLTANYLNKQKTEFLSVAAHELNTPLTVLRSYAELGQRFANTEHPKINEILTKVHIQSKKVATLVKQLLDLAKLENHAMDYQMEDIKWSDFIAKISEGLIIAFPHHNINFSDDPLATVQIDLLRVEQVLTNLIGNAAKYSALGSEIKVISTVLDGRLNVSVIDEGIGMPAETLVNIFEKFYRSNDVAHKFSGLGMGLYVASKILNDHGGSISVTSEVDAGSTFMFDLPTITDEL